MDSVKLHLGGKSGDLAVIMQDKVSSDLKYNDWMLPFTCGNVNVAKRSKLQRPKLWLVTR